MINMNKREIGSRYESLARTYLEKNNYKIKPNTKMFYDSTTNG